LLYFTPLSLSSLCFSITPAITDSYPLSLHDALPISFAIQWGYYVLFEALWDGQTPGKRRLGIRVVQDGGYSVSLAASAVRNIARSEEHTSELQSRENLVCRLLLEKKNRAKNR